MTHKYIIRVLLFPIPRPNLSRISSFRCLWSVTFSTFYFGYTKVDRLYASLICTFLKRMFLIRLILYNNIWLYNDVDFILICCLSMFPSLSIMLIIHLICLFSASTLFSVNGPTVKHWNLDSNSCVRTFQGHSSSVYTLAAIPDADRLLSGDWSGSVLLWDIASGQQLASVKAHSKDVNCLAVTPDGSSFVSGSNDCSLKLWRLDSLQQPVIQFVGHTAYVNSCVISSDGSRLYSGSSDKSIRVWNLTTGQQLASTQSHLDHVNCLALSGLLLVSGSDDCTVKLWDIGSMQLLHTLRGHSDAVQSVAVSSSGSQRVLSGSGHRFLFAKDCSVRVWDAASGAQLAVLQGHSNAVRCITVSSDGRFAASSSNDRSICVWDLASLSVCASLKDHQSNVHSVLFNVWLPTDWLFSLKPIKRIPTGNVFVLCKLFFFFNSVLRKNADIIRTNEKTLPETDSLPCWRLVSKAYFILCPKFHLQVWDPKINGSASNSRQSWIWNKTIGFSVCGTQWLPKIIDNCQIFIKLFIFSLAACSAAFKWL